MCNNILARTCNVTDNVHVNNIHFERDKSHFKGSYDKQNLSLVVISYEIHETSFRRVSYISYEMTMSVRSSMSPKSEHCHKTIVNHKTPYKVYPTSTDTGKILVLLLLVKREMKVSYCMYLCAVNS